MQLYRGDIYYADLGLSVGSEQKGRRPVIIVSNSICNSRSKAITVVPTTKQDKPNQPTHVTVPEGLLEEPSVILAEQVRTISINRLQRKICKASPQLMAEVDNALMIQLALTKNVNYNYLFDILDNIIKLKGISKREPIVTSTLSFLAGAFRDYCKQYNLNVKVVQTNYKINRALKEVKV